MLLFLACHSPAPDSAAPEVTYYEDVRPIVDTTCTRCHSDGGLAFSLQDPEQAVSMASAIAAAVSEGRMPPPAPDPECRDYADSERFVLSDADKETLIAWADAGAPLGDEADAPAVSADPLTSLAPYDVELYATQSYAPSFPGGEQNDYRCYLLDVGNTEKTWIRGMQAIIDNPTIVHHVVLFQPDGTDDLWDEGDPHDGFSCSGLGQGNWSTLGAWGPGANPTVLPDGIGIPLEAGSQVILQMHYFNSYDGAESETDQTGYGLLFTDDVEWEATNYAAGPTSIHIAAGDDDAVARQSYSWGEDAQILAVWPHMHLLGSGFEETLSRDGEDTCLLRMNDWSFHNQVTANLLEPVTIESGDRLKIACHYDNSAENPAQYNDPPQDVSFGEGTEDEMCFGFTLIATPVAR